MLAAAAGRLAAMPAAGPAATAAVGAAAPNFTLQGADGKTYELAATGRQRRVTVIIFWATWCAPCIRELPEFDEVVRKLAGRGVAVLAVNVMEPPQKVQIFARDLGAAFPLLIDTAGSAKAAFGLGAALPVTFIVDAVGTVRHRFEAATNGAVLRARVQTLLDEKPR